MIPKIIHYCWFGKNEKPNLIKLCIDSWHQYLPEYEIVEWNEDNFDVNQYKFTKTAYEQRKWAFVSDVARLTALIEFGGFYLDTDVEVLKEDPISEYCQLDNVFAFETERRIATGLFCGCEKDSPLFSKFLKAYENIDYLGNYHQLNTSMNFPILEKEYPTLKMNNQTQVINKTLFLSMSDYSKGMRHYGMRTWLDDKVDYHVKWKDNAFRRRIRDPRIYKFLGHKSKKLMHAYEFLTYDLLDMGLGYFLKRRIKIIKKKKNSEL